MSIDYDNEINQLLQGDAVPAHADTFFDTLQHHLDDEAGNADPSPETEATPTNVRAITPRHRRFYYYGSMISAAAAIVAIAMFAQSAFMGSRNGNEFDPTLASEVITRATSAYADIHALTGSLTTTNSRDDLVRTRDFRIVEDGSYRSTTTRKSSTIDDFQDSSYDATTGRGLFYSTSRFPNETKVVATEYDSPLVGGFQPLGFSLSNLLSGLAIDQHPEFRTITENGRAAWLIHARTDRLIVGIGDIAEYNLNEITAVFDQKTLLPVRIEAGGFTTVFTNMTTRDDRPSNMAAQFPAGVVPTKLPTNPNTFVADKEQLRSFDPTIALDLTVTPAGYKAGPIVVDKQSHSVTTTYRRGLQSFTYMLTIDGSRPGESQIFNGDEFRHPVLLRSGVFAGSTADLRTDFGALPQITATKEKLYVFIYGEATGDELVDMLNGLTAP